LRGRTSEGKDAKRASHWLRPEAASWREQPFEVGRVVRDGPVTARKDETWRHASISRRIKALKVEAHERCQGEIDLVRVRGKARGNSSEVSSWYGSPKAKKRPGGLRQVLASLLFGNLNPSRAEGCRTLGGC